MSIKKINTPNPELVEVLESLLEAAKKGTIVEFASVTLGSNTYLQHTVICPRRGNTLKLIGMLEILKQSLVGKANGIE